MTVSALIQPTSRIRSLVVSLFVAVVPAFTLVSPVRADTILAFEGDYCTAPGPGTPLCSEVQESGYRAWIRAGLHFDTHVGILGIENGHASSIEFGRLDGALFDLYSMDVAAFIAPPADPGRPELSDVIVRSSRGGHYVVPRNAGFVPALFDGPEWRDILWFRVAVPTERIDGTGRARVDNVRVSDVPEPPLPMLFSAVIAVVGLRVRQRPWLGHRKQV